MFEAKDLTLEEIRPTAQEMFDSGWRFITASVVDKGEGKMQMLFHFDRDKDIQHFRCCFEQGTVLPSISGIYFAALLVENENRDLFGLEYEGLVLDFQRTLFLEEAGDPMMAPFCKISTYKKAKSED